MLFFQIDLQQHSLFLHEKCLYLYSYDGPLCWIPGLDTVLNFNSFSSGSDRDQDDDDHNDNDDDDLDFCFHYHCSIIVLII